MVSWKSSKQTCIDCFTMEFELIALEKKTCSKAEWLQNLVDLLISVHLPTTMPIHYDCQVTIARARSKIHNGKSRYTRLRHSIIKQLLVLDVVSLDFLMSKLNLVDYFANFIVLTSTRIYCKIDFMVTSVDSTRR